MNRKSSSTVLLWQANILKLSVGHVAFKVSDGIYISFWPSYHEPWWKILSAKPCNCSWPTYDEDLAMKGQEDMTIEIEVNEEIVEKWLCKFKKTDPFYNVLKCNCANIVSEVLSAGCETYTDTSGLIKTPKRVFDDAVAAAAAFKRNDDNQTFQVSKIVTPSSRGRTGPSLVLPDDHPNLIYKTHDIPDIKAHSNLIKNNYDSTKIKLSESTKPMEKYISNMCTSEEITDEDKEEVERVEISNNEVVKHCSTEYGHQEESDTTESVCLRVKEIAGEQGEGEGGDETEYVDLHSHIIDLKLVKMKENAQQKESDTVEIKSVSVQGKELAGEQGGGDDDDDETGDVGAIDIPNHNKSLKLSQLKGSTIVTSYTVYNPKVDLTPSLNSSNGPERGSTIVTSHTVYNPKVDLTPSLNSSNGPERENFRALCTGAKVFGSNGSSLRCMFHGSMCQRVDSTNHNEPPGLFQQNMLQNFQSTGWGINNRTQINYNDLMISDPQPPITNKTSSNSSVKRSEKKRKGSTIVTSHTVYNPKVDLTPSLNSSNGPEREPPGLFQQNMLQNFQSTGWGNNNRTHVNYNVYGPRKISPNFVYTIASDFIWIARRCIK